MSDRQLVMGIDSGATHLRVTLADTEGTILAHGLGPGCNWHNNPGDLKRNITIAVKAALKSSKLLTKLESLSVKACCLGLSGLDMPQDFEAVAKMAATTAFKNCCKCQTESEIVLVNDAFLGLRFGSYLGYGVAVISGTGNQCYGVNQNGEVATAGNWGYLLGDQGSGFRLGQALLQRLMEEYDGRAPATLLEPAMLELYQVKSVEALYEYIYSADQPVSVVAKAASLLQQEKIISLPLVGQTLSHFLITHTRAFASVFHRLHFNSAVEMDVILMGGIFTHIPLITRKLSLELARITPAANIKILQEEPVLGAVEIALKRVNREPILLPKSARIV